MSTTDTAGTGGGRNGSLRLTLILAGLIGGLMFGALAEFEEYFSEPQGIGLASLVVVFTTAFVLTAGPGRFTAATLLAVIVALPLAALSYKAAVFEELHGAASDEFLNWFWFALGLPVAAYALTVFGLTTIEEKVARWPYSRVFGHLFGFPVQLLFGAAVVGLLNLLIFLWSELFEIIGIHVISELWEEPLLWMPMSGAFAGLGIALARQWPGITAALRTLCRYVARFALPIFAAFTITLLIALPAQGLSDLFKARSAAGLMSALAVFTILLVYGARQDLRETPPRWLRISTALAVLGLPVYTALAVWAIWLRVGQYGLTPERFAGLVLVLILFLHAAGLLAVQAFDLVRRNGWLVGAGPVNMAVLAVLAGFFLAVHTPQLDPYAVSAQSQYDRLADEKADPAEFDYGYLRFRLGPAGQRALDRLKELESHPQIGVIRANVALVEEAKNYWEWKNLQRKQKAPEPAPEE